MKRGLLILAGVVALVAVLTYLTLGNRKYRIEVCMEFRGQQSCRTASGETREQAQRAATDAACEVLASGMTDSMACTSSPPVGLRVLQP